MQQPSLQVGEGLLVDAQAGDPAVGRTANQTALVATLATATPRADAALIKAAQRATTHLDDDRYTGAIARDLRELKEALTQTTPVVPAHGLASVLAQMLDTFAGNASLVSSDYAAGYRQAVNELRKLVNCHDEVGALEPVAWMWVEARLHQLPGYPDESDEEICFDTQPPPPGTPALALFQRPMLLADDAYSPIACGALTRTGVCHLLRPLSQRAEVEAYCHRMGQTFILLTAADAGAEAQTFSAHQQGLVAQGATHDWVSCPICHETEMYREIDEGGQALITCVSHSCPSNVATEVSPAARVPTDPRAGSALDPVLLERAVTARTQVSGLTLTRDMSRAERRAALLAALGHAAPRADEALIDAAKRVVSHLDDGRYTGAIARDLRGLREALSQTAPVGPVQGLAAALDNALDSVAWMRIEDSCTQLPGAPALKPVHRSPLGGNALDGSEAGDDGQA